MHGRLIRKLSIALLLGLALAGPALAAHPAPVAGPEPLDWQVLPIALTFLLPVGFILLGLAALPEEQAVSAMTGAWVAWGLATLAYFGVGFAFQFGGIAVFADDPGLASLYWEYSLLDTTWGTGWGMLGLKGFLLLGEVATASALTLFLAQLPLLGVATLIPYFALHGRAPRWIALFSSLLMGSLVYPIVANWVWAGGWLANLGRNLGEGHGLIDAGGSGQVALVGAAAGLAALLVFHRSQNAAPTPERAPGDASPVSPLMGDPEAAEPQLILMPPVHLPLLGLLGAALMMIGWTGMALMVHLPTAADISATAMATNLVLGGLGGALAASLYSWFATSHLNPLMGARGLAAGLVVVAAGAPFIPAWSALAAGLLIGLLLPLLIFFFDHVLRLDDTSAVSATFGVPAVLALLLPALVADGRSGLGWNRVGAESFLGVAGQGVSGWLVAPGYAIDWPGQAYAQLVGMVAVFVWSFGLNWLLLRILVSLINAWERSGLEFGPAPEPAGLEEEPSLPPREEAQQPGRAERPGLAGSQAIAEQDVGQAANAPQA